MWLFTAVFNAVLFWGIVKAGIKQKQEHTNVKKQHSEHRLIDELLQRYNKFAHPKSYIDKSFNFTVTFGIEIVQLVAVVRYENSQFNTFTAPCEEDRNQRIITNCWVRQRWTNSGLRWKPEDYNNITTIRVSAEKVWIPDVLLYNSADTHQVSGGQLKYHTSIIIDYNGRHSWFAPTSFISTCKISVRYFPFDRQRCIMKFGSWTFQMNDLDIIGDENPIITSEYLQSAEWDLLRVWENRSVMSYACCEYPYSDLTITLEINRRPLFYIFNLMIPCFIIIAMVLMGFFLPPESGERATLSITVLLAMAVFLQLQTEYLPRNSEEIPLLGIFYITVMAEVGLSLMATCYVLNIFHKNSGVHIVPMHPFVAKFFLGNVASFLRVSSPSYERPAYEPDVERLRPTTVRYNVNRRSKAESDTQVYLIGKTADQGGDATSTSNVMLRSSRGARARGSPSKRSLIHSYSSTAIPTADCCSPISRSMAQNCAVLADSVKQKHEIRMDQERWKFLARVLDRMFFIVFIITIFISTMLIYFNVEFMD